MLDKRFALISLVAFSLSACASVDLPSIDLMGQSDFADEIEALDPDYPSLDDTPDIPNDVRSARDWDKDAREMEALLRTFDTPEVTDVMSDEEFESTFESAQAAAKAYQADDPS